jgi:hypothetical protein
VEKYTRGNGKITSEVVSEYLLINRVRNILETGNTTKSKEKALSYMEMAMRSRVHSTTISFTE